MKNMIKYIIAAATCFALYSCSGMDETYKEFLEHSDILYPGKVDSIKVFTGKERIKFEMLLSSDPKVNKLIIFWNGRLDSIETEIKPEEIGTRKELLISSIKEGDHTLYIYTYDHNNETSVPTEIVAKVYGNNFQNKLSNRYIISSNRYGGHEVNIEWDANNISYADERVEVNYEKTDGKQQTINVPAEEMSTILPDFKAGKPFTFQTYIRPDSSCMDEFAVEAKEQNVSSYYDVEKKENWKVKSISSEDATQTGSRCIDGYDKDDGQKSYWSSLSGDDKNYPHWIVIDMGQPTVVDAFYFVQRTSSYSAQLKDVEILTNETGDDSQPWVSLGSYLLNRKGERQNSWLEKTQTLRYVKFIFKDDWTNSKNLSLIELGALQRW